MANYEIPLVAVPGLGVIGLFIAGPLGAVVGAVVGLFTGLIGDD